MFFLIIASFSTVFPKFQTDRGKKKWTLFYLPLACMAVTLPLVLMGGMVRPVVGVAVFGLGGFLLWRRAQGGWRLEAVVEPVTQDGQDPSAHGQ